MKQVAAQAGISVGYVCDIEQSRRWPSPETEERLLIALSRLTGEGQ